MRLSSSGEDSLVGFGLSPVALSLSLSTQSRNKQASMWSSISNSRKGGRPAGESVAVDQLLQAVPVLAIGAVLAIGVTAL